jgi:hypothetical protein
MGGSRTHGCPLTAVNVLWLTNARGIPANGDELYGASQDTMLKRFDINGICLQPSRNHFDWVNALVVWRGALFSGGSDRKVIQWILVDWSPSTHKLFPTAPKQGIKTMMLLPKDTLLSRALPRSAIYRLQVLHQNIHLSGNRTYKFNCKPAVQGRSNQLNFKLTVDKIECSEWD